MGRVFDEAQIPVGFECPKLRSSQEAQATGITVSLVI